MESTGFVNKDPINSECNMNSTIKNSTKANMEYSKAPKDASVKIKVTDGGVKDVKGKEDVKVIASKTIKSNTNSVKLNENDLKPENNRPIRLQKEVNMTKPIIWVAMEDANVKNKAVKTTKPETKVTKPNDKVTKSDVGVSKQAIKIIKPDVNATKPDPDVVHKVVIPQVNIIKPDSNGSKQISPRRTNPEVKITAPEEGTSEESVDSGEGESVSTTQETITHKWIRSFSHHVKGMRRNALDMIVGTYREKQLLGKTRI
ncbi:unnamed protein product [Owenia fusiformis]|uniref:Uncharacterized protein n=1 Tax=Owenia fusiformis TaxID=6347 RepID=A0A8J1XJA1_OWEFU|nr:unnamed protein product [Owenia fusiformis]